MFRLITTLLFFLLAFGNARGQQIAAAEYFFDNNDPGFGNANAISGSFPSDSLVVSASAPVAGLLPGVHTLHVRCLDTIGIWWHYTTVLFSVELGFGTPIASAEAFIDLPDPGYGNATALS